MCLYFSKVHRFHGRHWRHPATALMWGIAQANRKKVPHSKKEISIGWPTHTSKSPKKQSPKSGGFRSPRTVAARFRSAQAPFFAPAPSAGSSPVAKQHLRLRTRSGRVRGTLPWVADGGRCPGRKARTSPKDLQDINKQTCDIFIDRPQAAGPILHTHPFTVCVCSVQLEEAPSHDTR